MMLRPPPSKWTSENSSTITSIIISILDPEHLQQFRTFFCFLTVTVLIVATQIHEATPITLHHVTAINPIPISFIQSSIRKPVYCQTKRINERQSEILTHKDSQSLAKNSVSEIYISPFVNARPCYIVSKKKKKGQKDLPSQNNQSFAASHHPFQTLLRRQQGRNQKLAHPQPAVFLVFEFVCCRQLSPLVYHQRSKQQESDNLHDRRQQPANNLPPFK